MAASRQDIQRWLEEGRSKGATHMLVVCDTFDYDDYPVYVYEEGKGPSMSFTDVNKAFKRYNGPNMQKVMEVYSYALPLMSQLDEHRAMHL